MLEGIIELLLNNIVFVIIAIGGILSFFKRMGSEEEETKPPSGPRRSIGPNQENPYSYEDNSSEQSFDLKPEQYDAYEEALERISSRDNASEELKVYKPNSSKHREFGGISIKKKDVKKGVIWSEILGPPRSKNPHPSMMKMKNSRR
ncbi:hypothetical protein [Alkalihalobacillus sp. CinArs1]|uniref:hypothetical protein n=1 Tax=Alkalihalobacillus sp. CinArs1 TaxID=2995314 RepID=UPI0022DDEF9C|nr:hypothetical protein [Alkalihalobacillus sp. CinArs1]